MRYSYVFTIFLKIDLMRALKNIIEKIDGWMGKTATDFHGNDEIANEPREPLWKENTYIDQPADKPRAEAAILSRMYLPKFLSIIFQMKTCLSLGDLSMVISLMNIL